MSKLLKTVKRYFRVYRVLLRLNLNSLFAYRANFINSVAANSSWAIFVIVMMLLLTSKASNIFGWTRYELLLMAGVYNIVFSIFYFFFTRNFGEFSNNIHFGRLDALLTKPIDIQFLMTCMHVSYTHGIRFVLGTGFVIFILQRMQVAITPLTISLFVIFLALSVIILYSLWLMVLTLTVWFTKLSNLVDLLYESHNVSRYPQEIYKGASIYAFYALFPLTLVVVIPVKALLQKMLLGDILWPIIVAGLMFFIARKFFLFALRSYTSASG